MNNFDSLILKFFKEENIEYLKNAIIQKIQQPTRSEIVLHLRNSGLNKKLYINIYPAFAHLCFIDDIFYEIPKNPPMFCMLLRKYLTGAKITDVIVPSYERILELHFENTNEIGEKVTICLAIELMGKYSNVILYNKNTNIIIGSAHNVSINKSSVREIYGGIKYIYPPKQNKKDILRISYNDFYIPNANTVDFINDNYFYLTKPLIKLCLNNAPNKEYLFNNLQNIINGKNADIFQELYNVSFNSYNDLIFKYYNNAFVQDMLNKRKNILIKKNKGEIKRLEQILSQDNKISKIDIYKTYGSLILANMQNVKCGDKYLDIDSVKIKLEPHLTPSENAQKYFELYKKAKNAQEIIKNKKNDALDKIKILNETIFYIENASSIFELKDENENIKEKEDNLNKILYDGFEIFIGRNQRQNSFILSKISKSEDFWFHLKDAPSCHVILRNPNKSDHIPDNVLLFCSKLVKENSVAKNSGKTSIIYTKRKYVNKQTKGIDGLVIYKNEKEIVIE